VVNQGSLYTLTATPVITGGPQSFTFTVLWGDGTNTTGQPESSVLFAHVYFVPGTYVVSMNLSNVDGSSVAESLVVQVNNVAPTVLYVAQATSAGYGTHVQVGSVNQGAPFTVGALYYDPGINDTHSATVDWGDSNIIALASLAAENSAGQGTLTAVHTYNNSGSYTVGVSVYDNSGAVGSGVLALTVVDVPPTIQTTPAPVLTGTLKYTGVLATCFDYSTVETFSVTIQWGDGSSTTYQSGVCIVQGTHLYTKKGVYFVLITVTDSHGGSSTATTTITLH